MTDILNSMYVHVHFVVEFHPKTCRFLIYSLIANLFHKNSKKNPQSSFAREGSREVEHRVKHSGLPFQNVITHGPWYCLSLFMITDPRKWSVSLLSLVYSTKLQLLNTPFLCVAIAIASSEPSRTGALPCNIWPRWPPPSILHPSAWKRSTVAGNYPPSLNVHWGWSNCQALGIHAWRETNRPSPPLLTRPCPYQRIDNPSRSSLYITPDSPKRPPLPSPPCVCRTERTTNNMKSREEPWMMSCSGRVYQPSFGPAVFRD